MTIKAHDIENATISDDLPQKHRLQHERETWGEIYLVQREVRWQLKFRWLRERFQPRVDLQSVLPMHHQLKKSVNSHRKIHQ